MEFFQSDKQVLVTFLLAQYIFFYSTCFDPSVQLMNALIGQDSNDRLHIKFVEFCYNFSDIFIFISSHYRAYAHDDELVFAKNRVSQIHWQCAWKMHRTCAFAAKVKWSEQKRKRRRKKKYESTLAAEGSRLCIVRISSITLWLHRHNM